MVAIGAGVLTAGQLGTAIAATVLLYIPRTDDIVHRVLWLSCAHYSLVFLASMLMAAALFYCLRRAHSEFDEYVAPLRSQR
ncbi:hypothetical protein BD413DRAFT_524227 [Trametes elegans]|nr:hypothetical protein BD413DRAFT_524227 [Trametes elegans]